MWLFIAGVIVGSAAMLFTLSLVAAAKRGDQQIEEYNQDGVN